VNCRAVIVKTITTVSNQTTDFRNALPRPLVQNLPEANAGKIQTTIF
jgi:hypothetical protein